MISLQNISKSYPVSGGMRTILDSVDFQLERGEKVGILGRNGAGKSTLIRLISGAEAPDSGKIVRDMSVSWPLAFGGAFQGSLTGLDNFRFICRIYDLDLTASQPFVEQFSGLGRYLNEPVKTYSSGMRARLVFAISIAVEFDCFLIDEVTAVGDSRFHQKCEQELFVNRADRAMLIVSHQAKSIREHCDRACVLDNGKLLNFSSVDLAYDYYVGQD